MDGWTHPVLRHPASDVGFYFAGRLFVGKIPEGIARTLGMGASVLLTHAGTHKVHLPYYPWHAAKELRSYSFSFEWQANDEADYYALLASAHAGAIHDFCPYMYHVDTFGAVSAGATYVLTRRFARSVAATGITAGNALDQWTVDGVDEGDDWPTSTAAQSFVASASASSVILRYLPVYRVVVESAEEAAAGFNDLRVSMTLTEILRTS